MSKVLIGLISVLVPVLLSAGWTNGFCAEQGTWHGYLVDKQCADSVKGNSVAESFVQAHTKDCAVMCKGKGYVFYSQGKWFVLDQKGNTLAWKLLQASKKMRGFYVEITGQAANELLLVENIREVSEPKVNRRDGVNHNGTH